MITYISHEQAGQKLCAYCQHSIVSIFGYDCNLKQNKVTGGPKYTCERARDSWWICGGRKWKLRDKVVPVDANLVEGLNREELIESYMPEARRQVETGTSLRPLFATKEWDEAYKRAKEEHDHP